jgi:hypothetical protein
MKKYIYFIILFILFFDKIIPEELKDWKITLKDDKIQNIKLEKLEANWSEVQIPVNFDEIISTKSKVLWLRKELQLDKNNSYSLIIYRVNGQVEVYFNEKLIKIGPNFLQSTLMVPLPMNLYQDGLNIIAIKFYYKSFVANGIHGPIVLLPTSKAIENYYYENFKSITNSVFFLGIGFFLFSLFLRFKDQTYYFYLSLFYLLLGFSSLLTINIILEEMPLSRIFYSLSMGIPILLPVFFLRFFSIYFNRPVLLKNFDLYLSFLLFLVSIISGFFNPAFSQIFNLLWILVFVIVFVYAIYIILLNLMERISFRNILSLVFLVYLFFVSFNSLINWNYFKEERFLYHFDVTIVLLIPAFLIIWEIIELQKDIEKKEGQFQSFDILQTKLFSYILTALKIPLKELIDALSKSQPKDLAPNQIKSIVFNIEDLEKNLNDILELSRLEVLEEPESYVEINVKDFLEAVLSKSNISSTIHVDPQLMLKTSLELVNSLLIRLIDFPGFGSFQHIDLIILSDDEDNIYFKFFLCNKNEKVLKRIYNILREKLPDQEGLWIQWKIIKETIRILGGKLKLKLYSKKYLYIEFILKAKESDSITKKKQKSIPLVYLYYLEEHQKQEKNVSIWQKIKDLLQKRIA